MSIGFDRSRERRKRELTGNKTIKGKYHVQIYLKDFFGSAENQGKTSFGPGYRLKLTRSTDNAIFNKANATNSAKIKINSLDWFVPHYTPNLEEYDKLKKHIMSKSPTNFHYPERSVLMKEVNTQTL